MRNLIILLFLGFTQTLFSQSIAPVSVEQFAQKYVQYANSGSEDGIDRLMNLFCKEPSVVSIQVGEIFRGQEAIRAKAMAFLPQARKIDFILGKITTVSIDPDTVLAVVSLRIAAKLIPTATAPSREAAISWVLRRCPEGWCILQEHFSLMPAPSVPAPKPESEH